MQEGSSDIRRQRTVGGKERQILKAVLSYNFQLPSIPAPSRRTVEVNRNLQFRPQAIRDLCRSSNASLVPCIFQRHERDDVYSTNPRMGTAMTRQINAVNRDPGSREHCLRDTCRGASKREDRTMVVDITVAVQDKHIL